MSVLNIPIPRSAALRCLAISVISVAMLAAAEPTLGQVISQEPIRQTRLSFMLMRGIELQYALSALREQLADDVYLRELTIEVRSNLADAISSRKPLDMRPEGVETFEELAGRTVTLMPGWITKLKEIGALPEEYKLPEPLELKPFISLDPIETTTVALDAANRGAWDTVGFLGAGVTGAAAYPSLPRISQIELRHVVLPLLDEDFVEWRDPSRQLILSWLSRQTLRLHHGLRMEKISEFRGGVADRQDLARETIRSLDEMVAGLDRRRLEMSRDWQVARIQEIGQTGCTSLAGVRFQPPTPQSIRRQAEFLYSGATRLHEALHFLADNFGAEEDFRGMLDDSRGFIDALGRDLEWSRDHHFRFEQSHLLEQMARYALGKMPELVGRLQKSGKLSRTFRFPTTYGLDSLAAAVGTHAGAGRADIDVITGYLNAANEAAWATVGALVAGPEGAAAFQAAASQAVATLREITLPLFEAGVRSSMGDHVRQLRENYVTLQEQRVRLGLPLLEITEVYPEAELRGMGFTSADIAAANAGAAEQSRSLLKIWNDFDVAHLQSFAETGELELGGVRIEFRSVEEIEGDSAVRDSALTSRPSTDSAVWSFPLPKEKEKEKEQ